MDWIDKLNKELEERRERNKTPEAKEQAYERMKKGIASNAGKARGAIMGKVNVESGHWQNLLVMGGKVQGKIQGKKNVESGHLDRIREAQKKAILQLDKDGNFIKEYESQGDAARENNLSQAKISEVCNGNRKSHGGFVWKFKE